MGCVLKINGAVDEVLEVSEEIGRTQQEQCPSEWRGGSGRYDVGRTEPGRGPITAPSARDSTVSVPGERANCCTMSFAAGIEDISATPAGGVGRLSLPVDVLSEPLA